MARVLIVDDVKTARDALARLVSELGHEPVLAEDGAHAIEYARRLRPALIFLDVVMPEQDGFATCRALRNDPDTKAIPIVMVTTKAYDSDRFWSKRQGASDHIGKPYRAEAIRSVISRYVG